MSDTVALKKFYCDIVRSLEAELKKRGPQTSVRREIEKFGQVRKIYDRRNGRKFSINEHAEAMIMAMLSCQTEWWKIQSKYDTLKKDVFGNFNVNYLKRVKSEELVSLMEQYNCGKPSACKQKKNKMELTMDSIAHNIKVLESIPDIDEFLGKTKALVAVDYLDGKNGSPVKLRQMSTGLIPEYMRNCGINMAKPDTHILRLLNEEHFKEFFEISIDSGDLNKSAEFLGVQNYTKARKEFRAVITISALAKHLDSVVYAGQTATATEVDNVLWMFCANKYGEICTKTKPRCCICQARDRCATGTGL